MSDASGRAARPPPSPDEGGEAESGAPHRDEIQAPSRFKRRFARLTMPLDVRINDRVYPTVEWSLGGFRIADIGDLGLVGNRVSAAIIAPFEDFYFVFWVSCEAVRIDPAKREAAFKFCDLTTEQKSALGYFISAHLAGRIVNVDGVLKHAAPAHSGAKQQADKSANPVERWVRRGAQGLVAALALAIVALLLRAVFLHAFSVPAAAAWIDVRQLDVVAGPGGSIARIAVSEGDVVAPGDVLIELRRQEVESERAVAAAELARLEVERANIEAAAAARARVLDQERALAEADRAQAEARAERARTAVAAAEASFEARRTLHARGVVARPALDAAERALVDAQAMLAQRQAELAEAHAEIEIAAIGYFYGESRIAGEDPSTLARELSDVGQEIEVARAHLEGLDARLAEHVLVSPCDCIVAELPRRAGEVVGAMAPVAVLSETSATSRVAAFVTHDGARHLRVGQRATVRLADGVVDDAARIVAIEAVPRRTALAHLAARDLEADRHAEITIGLSVPAQTRQPAPAQVTFVRSPWGWLERMLYVAL